MDPNEQNPGVQAGTENTGSTPEGGRVKKRGWLMPVVIILILIIIAGGAYASWSALSKTSPQDLATKAFENLQDVKTLELNGGVNVDAGDEGSFDINYSIAGDQTDEENIKAKISVDVGADVEGKSVNVGVDVRTFDKIVYAEITKAPPILAMFGVPTNQWIRFDPEKLQDEFGDEADFSDIDSKETIKDIQNIMRKYQSTLITVTEPYPGEVVDGIDTRHLAFTVDKDAFVSLMDDIVEYQMNHASTSAAVNGVDLSQEKKDAHDAIVEFSERVSNLKGELWVGAKNVLPRKLTLSFDAADETGDETEVVHVEASLNYKSFNQPVTVEEPKDFIPFTDYLHQIQQSFSFSAGGSSSSPSLVGQ